MDESACTAQIARDRRRGVARRAAPFIAAVLLWIPPAAHAAIPAQPVLKGSVSRSTSLSGATSMAVSGHYAHATSYAAGMLTAVDISNPAGPFCGGSERDGELAIERE